MTTGVAAELRDFISSAYLFGDDSRMPGDADSLLESGVLDSTGVLELIEFLEDTYQISVEDSETVPENLGSIDGLTRFVLAKTGRTAGAA
jgi:acyl carrier protein